MRRRKERGRCSVVWSLDVIRHTRHSVACNEDIVLHIPPHKEHFTCILIRPSYWHEQKSIPMGNANPYRTRWCGLVLSKLKIYGRKTKKITQRKFARNGILYIGHLRNITLRFYTLKKLWQNLNVERRYSSLWAWQCLQ